MVVKTPPMGWNSWNTFYDQVSEELICSTADAMVSQGLAEAGYRYVIIDDCWAKKSRDEHGNLEADPEKFPNGIRPLADYVHSLGLKIGIYSCCGVHTCAGYPGSFEHEFADARQFASWGIDYLKYDNCFHPSTLSSEMLYRRMNMALRSSGRQILLAACQWGRDGVHRWIRSTGAQTFRSTIDIQDAWKSVEQIALSQMEEQYCAGSGCYNDMDILVVGMHGKGLNPETSIGGCTDIEYQTHFALWAMMNSPLIIGCDVRNMDETTRKILTNRELIAINQDPECRTEYFYYDACGCQNSRAFYKRFFCHKFLSVSGQPLHERRDDSKRPTCHPGRQAVTAAVLQSDPLAFPQRVLEIRLHI